MDIPWDKLDAGIINAVRLLWANGFCPVDSGDGSKFETAPDEALDFPHVFVQVEPADLSQAADQIAALPWESIGFTQPEVSASYFCSDKVALVHVLWSRKEE